jgi:hypothetical protein
MFKRTVHPLDLLLAVLAAALPGSAVLYWLAKSGRLPFDFIVGVGGLVFAAAVMLCTVGGLVWFAVWFFGPKR